MICRLVWPRDLCYVRYWRFNDDGSYGILLNNYPIISETNTSELVCLSACVLSAVVLFQSREHPKCRPQQGYVRAHIESNFSSAKLFKLNFVLNDTIYLIQKYVFVTVNRNRQPPFKASLLKKGSI